MQAGGSKQQHSSLSKSATGVDLEGDSAEHVAVDIGERVDTCQYNGNGRVSPLSSEKKKNTMDQDKDHNMQAQQPGSSHLAQELTDMMQSGDIGLDPSPLNEEAHTLKHNESQCQSPPEEHRSTVTGQNLSLYPYQVMEGPNTYIKEVCGESTYFVQFPEDEQETSRQLTVSSICDWENRLAVTFENSLRIKRKREETGALFVQHPLQIPEDEVTDGKRRKVDSTQQLSDCSRPKMAEEAGLIMPHPQP